MQTMNCSEIVTCRFFNCRADRSRWSEPDWEELTQDLFTRCIQQKSANPSSFLGSLYTGSLGPQVYLKWHMARIVTDSAKAAQLRDEAQERVQKELAAFRRAQGNALQLRSDFKKSQRFLVSLLEGPFVGCKAMSAVLYYDQQNKQRAFREKQELIDALQTSCQHLPADECEVLYGRAGALEVILFLRYALNEENLATDFALSLSRSILRNGRDIALSAKPTPPLSLVWTFHSTFYLGAAHGVAGILQTIISLNIHEREILEKENGWMSMIQRTIDELDAYCFSSDNLDSSAHRGGPRQGRDRLVQWCHGAPGHVMLLAKAAVVFSDKRYQERAKQICNNVIFRRGLLQKGVGLCHGISGNAYALLTVDRNDPLHIFMAKYYADFAWAHLELLQDRPDNPFSLYEGLTGLCCLTIDLLHPQSAHFPLFEFDTKCNV